jgi:hypothetical protein
MMIRTDPLSFFSIPTLNYHTPPNYKAVTDLSHQNANKNRRTKFKKKIATSK